jgi:branched-chain amino acid transport system ATP-binding protein
MNKNVNDNSYILKGCKVTKKFGGLIAIHEVDFAVRTRSVMGLIGPNGAGKTTLFNCISGNHKPTTGAVLFEETNLTPLPVYKITKLGIARTFQNIRLFRSMSVLENVLVGLHTHIEHGLWDVLFASKNFMADEKHKKAKALELLEVCGLTSVRDDQAKNLSYGAQRRLEIARALATEPKLLLLDEPTAGMNNNETDMLSEFIRVIKDQFKLTIVLIEHDMKFVMGLCDRIMVLNNGQKIAEGLPQEIQNNDEVIQAYLGRGISRAQARKS